MIDFNIQFNYNSCIPCFCHQEAANGRDETGSDEGTIRRGQGDIQGRLRHRGQQSGGGRVGGPPRLQTVGSVWEYMGDRERERQREIRRQRQMEKETERETYRVEGDRERVRKRERKKDREERKKTEEERDRVREREKEPDIERI